MTHKTILLSVDKAAKIQQTATDYNCVVLNIALSSNNRAVVSISGDDTDIERLLKSVGE